MSKIWVYLEIGSEAGEGNFYVMCISVCVCVCIWIGCIILFLMNLPLRLAKMDTISENRMRWHANFGESHSQKILNLFLFHFSSEFVRFVSDGTKSKSFYSYPHRLSHSISEKLPEKRRLKWEKKRKNLLSTNGRADGRTLDAKMTRKKGVQHDESLICLRWWRDMNRKTFS